MPAPAAAARGAARQLTTALAAARCAAEVLQLVRRHLESFDRIHTTTCLHALARHRGSLSAAAGPAAQESFAALLQRHASHLQQGDLDGRQLANTIWAAATLRSAAALPQGFLHGTLEQLAGRSRRLNHQDVANSLWALAVLGFPEGGGSQGSRHTAATRSLAASPSLARPAGFRPQELSNSLWALAHLGAAPARSRPLAEAAAARRAELQPQHLANVAWAIAAAGLPGGGGLVVQLSAEAGRRRGGLKAQEVSNTAWALATVGGGAPTPVLAALAAAAPERAREFGHQELVNSCWAFAELGTPRWAGRRAPGR